MSFEIKSNLEWNGSIAMADFDKATLKALTESAILVEGTAAKAVHVDTGLLRSSITRQVNKDTAYVGTNVEYAPYEEFGTRYRKAHPFLRPSLTKSINKIKNIFIKYYKAVKYVD
jgi:HK97 gp10 family phage protein